MSDFTRFRNMAKSLFRRVSETVKRYLPTLAIKFAKAWSRKFQRDGNDWQCILKAAKPKALVNGMSRTM